MKLVPHFLLIGSFLVVSCTDLGEGERDRTPNVSFSYDIQPIFNSSCALSGCHLANHISDMDLTASNSYLEIVDVVSQGDPYLKRVLPGDPDSSVLYLKVIGDPMVGDKMPPINSLDPDHVEKIYNWILEGAKEN